MRFKLLAYFCNPIINSGNALVMFESQKKDTKGSSVTKRSSNTLLCLVSFFATQTLQNVFCFYNHIHNIPINNKNLL